MEKELDTDTGSRIPLKNSVTPGWIRWIQENISLGVPQTAMLEAMKNDGIDPKIANAMLETTAILSAQALKDPGEAKERKMEWIFDTLSKLDSLHTSEIPHSDINDPKHFYATYYAPNKPVILRGWKHHAPLKSLLDWETLEKNFAHEEVEVQSGRTSDKNYERNSDNHKRFVNFGEFLNDTISGKENNDIYLTANNGERNHRIFEAIMDSPAWLPPVLDENDFAKKSFLWIGPKGTKTQLHHDLTNNLLLQVAGTKVIHLFPPVYFPSIYNTFHCYSDFDCETPDFDRFPRAEKVNVRKCVLQEGEALFLPVGWWHQVKSTSPSISITSINFREYNRFFEKYTTYKKI